MLQNTGLTIFSTDLPTSKMWLIYGHVRTVKANFQPPWALTTGGLQERRVDLCGTQCGKGWEKSKPRSRKGAKQQMCAQTVQGQGAAPRPRGIGGHSWGGDIKGACSLRNGARKQM